MSNPVQEDELMESRYELGEDLYMEYFGGGILSVWEWLDTIGVNRGVFVRSRETMEDDRINGKIKMLTFTYGIGPLHRRLDIIVTEVDKNTLRAVFRYNRDETLVVETHDPCDYRLVQRFVNDVREELDRIIYCHKA